MEIEARDEALQNPLIVSTILSVLQGPESFLNFRLVNKLWDSEALHAYPRREGLFLKVDTYMEQKDLNEGALLPLLGSPLVARVYFAAECYDVQHFLAFFKAGVEGPGGKTEVLFLNHFISYKDQGVTWGDALYTILKNNWAPNLREFILKFSPDAKLNYVIEDQDLSGGLGSLRVLDIRCDLCTWEMVKKGPFTLLVKAILRGALNLEKLRIKGPFFPDENDVRALKNLKVFELNLFSQYVTASTTPEIERVIQELSINCPLVEDLCLFLPRGEQLFEAENAWAIRLPRFPKVKKFICQVSGLPEGDFLHVLKEKMPCLRSCSVRPSGDVKRLGVRVEDFLRALQSSPVGKSEGVLFLSIPGPQRRDLSLLQGLNTKFPCLKGLNVDAYSHSWFGVAECADDEPDWLSDLAVFVAAEFPFPSTISTGVNMGCERAKEMFLEEMGPQYKGTLDVFNNVVRQSIRLKELRLTPEKED